MIETEKVCNQCEDTTCMNNIQGNRVAFVNKETKHEKGTFVWGKTVLEIKQGPIQECPIRETPEDAEDVRNLGC